MATRPKPLYMYTWRLPYIGVRDTKQTIVIYNYAPDKDWSRHYAQLELEHMGGQETTIDKLGRGVIYPKNAFLTDESVKPPTARVYFYDQLPPGTKTTNTDGSVMIDNENIWRRAKQDIDKSKDRMAERNTGLWFKEYIFQDIHDDNIHYIAKTIVSGESDESDYQKKAIAEIDKQFGADEPRTRNVKAVLGDLDKGVKMGYRNKPGVIEIVKVTNWAPKGSLIKSASIYADVKTYEELKKERKRVRRQRQRKNKQDGVAPDTQQDKAKAKRDVGDKPPGTKKIKKAQMGSSNKVDFGLDSVPSKYRV